MADISRNRNSGTGFAPAPTAGTQPSRLQRRKPASLQINPPTSSRWNAAIPLLSPLISSPTAMDHRMLELNNKSRGEEQQQPSQQRNLGTEPEKTAAVFKKWQHPAAPFCCEPASFAPTFFVPV